MAAAVAVLHGMNDAYTAFLPPLLPRIMQDMGLSITLAATLVQLRLQGPAADRLEDGLDIAVDRWSTPAEQELLTSTLFKGDEGDLLEVVREAPHRPLAPARRRAETLRVARRAARRLAGDLDPGLAGLD